MSTFQLVFCAPDFPAIHAATGLVFSQKNKGLICGTVPALPSRCSQSSSGTTAEAVTLQKKENRGDAEGTDREDAE